jgi:hypothetical protein
VAPSRYGRSRSGKARRGSIARLEQGDFRTQTMASRRERTKDSPTRWRFRLPSPGTFRLQPCGGPRTASGPGFNLNALRGRRSRDSRPSLPPGQQFAARACRSLRRYRSAGPARLRSSPGARAPLHGLSSAGRSSSQGLSDRGTGWMTPKNREVDRPDNVTIPRRDGQTPRMRTLWVSKLGSRQRKSRTYRRNASVGTSQARAGRCVSHKESSPPLGAAAWQLPRKRAQRSPTRFPWKPLKIGALTEFTLPTHPVRGRQRAPGRRLA